MFRHIHNTKNSAEIAGFTQSYAAKYVIKRSWFFFVILISCVSNNSTMKNNPLLCDPETGACEIPATRISADSLPVTGKNQVARMVYFTDPICSSCWGIEPQLKKLKLEYGASFVIEYRMGGLLPNWDIYNSGGISKPADVAHHWDEVSRYYQMPIDGDVWLEDPLPSSYPPSIAFKAAQMQDSDKAIAFLRYLREDLFLKKINITRWEPVEAAAEKAGLDTELLKRNYEKEAPGLFEQDLLLARQMGVRGFPTIFFFDADNNYQLVYGTRPYEEYEKALLKIQPEAVKQTYTASWQYLFEHFPGLTAKEFSVLMNISPAQAEKQLDELYKQSKLSKIASKNGHLWAIKL